MHFYNKQIPVKHFRWRSTVVLLILTLALTSCGYERLGINLHLAETGESYFAEETKKSQEQLQKEQQDAFEDFCLEVFRGEMADGSTLDLHYMLLHPESYGIETGEITLGTYRLEDMIENTGLLKNIKSQLLAFDRTLLNPQQKVTYDALQEVLETRLMAEGLELYEQPLAPTIGVQAQLPILLAEYAFYSAEDVEHYLALVEDVDEYYGEILKFEQQKAAAGLGPSDASIDAIMGSCRGYLLDPGTAASSDTSISDKTDSAPNHTAIRHHVLSETFFSRLKELETTIHISEKQKNAWISRHDQALLEHFIPAYETLIEGMSALKGRGINDGGLANFQSGTDYYEYLVACGPATSYTVPELKEALTRRMEQDIRQISQLFIQYPDLENRLKTAAFSLTDPNEILEDLKRKMKTEFPELPSCEYDICYVPKALEPILSPAFYLTAPLDNTDQNVIYINNSYSAHNLYTTLAHEGFPGHLYQTVYSRTNQQDVPLLSVLSCSGANEGWATYVEYYANMYDNGLPEGVGTYYALLRSYSLCVHGLLDIGINYEGWDWETANAFVSSRFQIDEATMNELWQVMIDNPANYLCYCGGFVEIMEMRDAAELALGSGFSAMEFHKFLLDLGPVPFSVIRTHFEAWLNAQI